MSGFVTIQEKIKKFTEAKPTNTGATDPDYKAYLAECSRLLDIDIEMSTLKNDIYPSQYVDEKLIDIEKEVDRIVNKRIM